MVCPVKCIFKLSTFCVSDFKFATRFISGKPRGRAKTNVEIKYHHTRIEDGFKSRLKSIATNRCCMVRNISILSRLFSPNTFFFIVYILVIEKWKLGLTLALIIESSFQQSMYISSYSYSNFRPIKNKFLLLQDYIIISDSLVAFLGVDGHYLEIWWTFYLCNELLMASQTIFLTMLQYVISRKNLPKINLSCDKCMT